MTKKSTPSVEEKIVVGVVRAIWFIISLPFKMLNKKGSSTHKFRQPVDYQYYHEQWAGINRLAETSGASNFRMAVLEADKLFDTALKNLAVHGETMGERLKSAERLMDATTYNKVWQAHKLRNRLVHEIDDEVMSWEVKEALQEFEAGLRQLNVLRG